MTMFRNVWFDGAVIGGAVLLGLVAAGSLALVPRDPATNPASPLAVVFPPWTSPQAAMARAADAGARIVGSGGLPSVVIAAPDSPDYAANVRRLGAWMVVDAQWLAGCFAPVRS